MRILVLDGDDTLWVPLSGLFLSDRAPDDVQGADFTFQPTPDSPNVVRRSDGALFELREDAVPVLADFRRHGSLTALASYNRLTNVNNILIAFGIRDLFDYVVAEWHSDKGLMLREIVEAARQDGHKVAFEDVCLVDDDYYGLYAEQCKRLGARFLCFGKDVHALSDLQGILKHR